MRPKDEPIAQKGPPPIPIPRPTLSPPLIFDENYPLTRENNLLYSELSEAMSYQLSIYQFNSIYQSGRSFWRGDCSYVHAP
jgi:hypothetical protein